MKLTGIKILIWTVRGRPSRGTTRLIVSPDQIEYIARREAGLHVYIRDQPEYQNRKVLNEGDVEHVLIRAGLGHLIR